MNMLCPHCWGIQTMRLDEDTPNSLQCSVCSGAGYIADQQLSTNFKLSELIRSSTALRNNVPNNPTTQIISNLTQLCTSVLEPIRTQFGALHIDSAYRCPALNKLVRGSSTSAHPFGWAADINPVDPTVTRKAIVDWIIASALDYDQVIFEGTWVHIALFDSTGTQQRKMALTMFPDPESSLAQYVTYDPTDPRVST